VSSKVQGKVEWRDCDYGADGDLEAEALAPRPAGDGVERDDLAAQALGLFACKHESAGRAIDLCSGFPYGLSGFVGEDGGYALTLLGKPRGDLEKDIGPLAARHEFDNGLGLIAKGKGLIDEVSVG
jgi:hypothetical protein